MTSIQRLKDMYNPVGTKGLSYNVKMLGQHKILIDLDNAGHFLVIIVVRVSGTILLYIDRIDNYTIQSYLQIQSL